MTPFGVDHEGCRKPRRPLVRCPRKPGGMAFARPCTLKISAPRPRVSGHDRRRCPRSPTRRRSRSSNCCATGCCGSAAHTQSRSSAAGSHGLPRCGITSTIRSERRPRASIPGPSLLQRATILRRVSIYVSRSTAVHSFSLSARHPPLSQRQISRTTEYRLDRDGTG